MTIAIASCYYEINTHYCKIMKKQVTTKRIKNEDLQNKNEYY